MIRLLLLLSLTLLSLACSHSRPQGNPAMSSPIKVVTANLRNSGARDGKNAWNLRKDTVLAHFRQVDPDFLGVQEALADQQDQLTAAFPDYTPVGVAREDGKRKGEWASLFIRKARFDVLDSGTFWLSTTPETVGSVGWDAALTRICSWARVKDKSSGKELLLANTHFDHMGVKAREESAKLIATRLPTLFPGRPMILTGDFNSDDTTSAYTSILSCGLLDAYREVHPVKQPNEESFHDFKGGTEGTRIDFIFHTPDFKPTAAEIDRTQRGAEGEGLYLSDHYFVTATLAWAK